MEFIKYCIWCMLSVIAQAFGYNQYDVTIIDSFVGFAGVIVVCLVFIGIVYITRVISIKISKNKANKNKNQE